MLTLKLLTPTLPLSVELAGGTSDYYSGATSPSRSHQLHQHGYIHRRRIVSLQYCLVVRVLCCFGGVYRRFVVIPGQRDVLDG